MIKRILRKFGLLRTWEFRSGSVVRQIDSITLNRAKDKFARSIGYSTWFNLHAFGYLGLLGPDVSPLVSIYEIVDGFKWWKEDFDLSSTKYHNYAMRV